MKRNSTVRNMAQIIALTVMTMGSTAALIAIPATDNPAWFASLIGTKALAAAGVCTVCGLYRRWRRENRWLSSYDRFCREADEAMNPINSETEVDA